MGQETAWKLVGMGAQQLERRPGGYAKAARRCARGARGGRGGEAARKLHSQVSTGSNPIIAQPRYPKSQSDPHICGLTGPDLQGLPKAHPLTAQHAYSHVDLLVPTYWGCQRLTHLLRNNLQPPQNTINCPQHDYSKMHPGEPK